MLALTLSGFNHSLCSELIGPAKANYNFVSAPPTCCIFLPINLGTENAAILLALTLSGFNHSLCSELIGPAKANVVDTLIFYLTGKAAFSNPIVHVSSFTLFKAGTLYCVAALLNNVFPPVRFLILYLLEHKVILLCWCTISSTLMTLLHLSRSDLSSLMTLLPDPFDFSS